MATARRRPFCHPSPNEEVFLRQSQLEERRKARLLQVREQEKILARQLREKVKMKREAERLVLKEHVDAALAEAHEVELRELEEKYLSRVNSVGQGHRDAQQVNEEENRLQEIRLLLEAKQRWRAQDRHAAAMKELTDNQLKDKQSQEHVLRCRQQALQEEKRRAKQVATASPPANQMIIMNFEVDRGRRVQFKEADSFSSSHYHILNPVVERNPDDTELPSAQVMAQLQTDQDKKVRENAAALQCEQDEKARLRYKAAISKVKLEKERTEMLAELQILEREDRVTRQKSLAKMPKNMFQPAHRRIEMASEQQREMEGAFERLFARTQHGVPVTRHQSSLSCEQSLTEQSLSTHSDLSSQRDNIDEEIVEASPKVTPDSGVHADAGLPSTEDETDSIHPQSTLEFDGGVPNETIISSSDDSRQPPRRVWSVTREATDSQVATRATSTQTHRPNQHIVSPSYVLDRPELTVTETSSDDQSSRQGATGEQRRPATNRRGEGIKTLLSMIQSQNKAWNDRLRKREERMNSPTSQISDSVEQQADTLSVYTLSTRESTLSPTHVQPPSIRSDRSTTPNELSISQYNTSLDLSALPAAPSASHPHTGPSQLSPASRFYTSPSQALPASHTHTKPLMAPNPLVQHSQTYASSKVNSGTVVHKPFLSVSMDSEDKFDSFMSLPQPQPPPSPSPHPPTTLSTHYTEASPVQAPITLPTHYTEGQGVHTQFLLESSSLEFTPLPMDVKNGAPLEHSIPTEENPELSILTLDSTQIQPVSSPPVSENVLAPSRESSILDISDHAIENNSDSFRGDRLQDELPLSITGLDSTDYSHSELHANAGSTQTTTSPMRTQVAPTTPSVMEREENPDPEVDTPFAPPAPAQSEFSLQEAFLRRKKNFVKKSQQRLEQIKATIEEQKFQQASTLKESFGRKHSRNPNSSTSFGSKSSFSGSQKQKLDSEVEKKRRVVTFASPLLQTSAEPAKPHSTQKGQFSGWLFSKDKEEIKKKEMRERNQRFYSRLPEVRKKMEEEKRSQDYSANREKARVYQEKIRSRMRSQRSGKNMKTVSSTKTPPFK